MKPQPIAPAIAGLTFGLALIYGLAYLCNVGLFALFVWAMGQGGYTIPFGDNVWVGGLLLFITLAVLRSIFGGKK